MSYRKSKHKKPIVYRLFITLNFALLSLIAFSGASVAQQALSLEQAINLTLEQHPKLKRYIHQSNANKGLIKQAGVGTPLIINAELEDAFGTGSRSGVSSLESTLSVSWLLEQKRLDAQVKVAGDKAAETDVSRDIEVLDLAAETARLYITLLSQQEQLKLAKLATQQNKDVLKDLTRRVSAGQLSQIDQLRAQAELHKKELVVEDLLHEIEATKSQLAAQWQQSNQALNDDFVATDSLLNIPSIRSLENAYEELRNSPVLQKFATRQRVAQSEIALAKATEKPAWRISSGVRRNESVDDFSFVAGITIPFGATDRNQGKIAALTSQQQEQQVLADAWQRQASTRLLVLTHKLKHSQHVIENLTNEVLPILEQANTLAADAYKKGSYSLTDWFSVQQEQLLAQSELIEAYTNIHLNNVELERLTGASLTSK
ncbi:TolC family protein [Alteromonadaceae bacterium M269]|nr:TolC family protein [Alteromonadaceae bacterium M269]